MNLESRKYSEHFIHSCGTKIVLSIYDFGKTAPCVIFLPGTMTHPLFYDDFLSKLRDQGFNIIGIHFVAHGKSPREKELFSFDDLVQNVKDTVTFCIEEYNDKIILLGSSQGGILCLAAAINDPRIKAIFPHNMALFSMKDTIRITIYPFWLKPFYHPIRKIIKLGAKLFPTLNIPIQCYISFQKVTRSNRVKEQFFSDPIGRVSYPLYFLSSFISTDLSGIANGGITCPVFAIINQGDTLFPYDYCRKVFETIKAPQKETLIFNEPCHLLLNECVDTVIGPVYQKIKECCEFTK